MFYGDSLNTVSYTTKLLVTRVRCVTFNTNFAFQTNLFTFIFNLHPCLSSLSVSCPCVSFFIYSVHVLPSTFCFHLISSFLSLLHLLLLPLCLLSFSCFLLSFPPPPFSPPLPCCFSSFYFLFLIYPFLRCFFSPCWATTVLLLYTSVLVPCLTSLDPWFLPFSFCFLLLLVTPLFQLYSWLPFYLLSFHLGPLSSYSLLFLPFPHYTSACSFQPLLLLRNESVPFDCDLHVNRISLFYLSRSASQHPSIPFLVTSILPHESFILWLLPHF